MDNTASADLNREIFTLMKQTPWDDIDRARDVLQYIQKEKDPTWAVMLSFSYGIIYGKRAERSRKRRRSGAQ